jgi:site-specific recombinase
MAFPRKKITFDFIESISRRSSVLNMGDKKQGLDFLVSFFSAIRPGKTRDKKDAAKNMEWVLDQMHIHPILLTNLKHALLSQLINTDLSPALTESGISLAGGFWQEFFGRMRHKILPSLQNENDFLYVVNRVFFREDDYQWVEDIPHELWTRFFEEIGLSIHVDDQRIILQLIKSLKILSFQVARFGLEKEVYDHLPPEDLADNPFLDQNCLVQELEKQIQNPEENENIKDLYFQLKELTRHEFQSIGWIRQNHSSSGTSLHQTYLLVVLGNKLDRMNLLVDVLDKNQHFNAANFVSFFKTLVRNENRKNSIREFLSLNLGYLAYQIAEHKGTKGSAYITSNPKEYRRMIWSAMMGGVIISFVAVIKGLISKTVLPIFWHGFAYSINDSAGFVTIDVTGSTLATKQPAFTASALAGSLDTKQNTLKPNLYNLALTVAKVSRSQFASFLGNLIIVFPGTYLLAWLFHLLTHSRLLDTAEAMAVLENQHPWHSLSLLYACNTGFFLFLSGIIAGYVQNKIRYGHIGERLKNHPLWRVKSSPEKLNRRSKYIEKNAGTLAGSISLGFMIGMSSVVSKFTGLPFDARHITISSGEVSSAVYSLGFENIPSLYLLTVFLGVLGIGFLNFVVSFAFAFFVAVRSRGVRLRDYPEFLGILWRYFWKRPLDFIRPRRHVPEPE